MAYIGSLPFTIEARTECSVLLRSGNHLLPTSSFFAYSPRKSLVCAGLSDPPIECSKVAVLRGCSESWTWRIKRAAPESMCGAVGRNSSGGEETEELEDTFEATIEKSKRSLALQRDLLQQIAEKRKQVSSIISSTIESEDSGAYKEEETYIPNLGLASTSNNNSEEQHDGDILSSSHLHSTTVEMPEGLPSVTGTGLREEKKQVERSLTPDKLFSMSNRMSDKFPSFLSSSSETTHVKYGEREELREPALQMSSEVNDPASEDIKPPPLAGANVMNVILVTAECAPWSKTGGLGDVAGALPKALARRGHRMMVVAPRYGNYAEPKDTGVRNLYRVDGQDVEVTYLHAYIDDVDFVFIDCHMFRHMENDIYGGNRVDILKRMILFCKVAVEVPWHVPCGGVCYGDGNLVFIANDWHTALLPVYLKAYYHDRGLMKYARSVLVIHNIAHQGRGPLHDFFYADLPEHYIDLFKLYDPLGGEHFNIFAAGIKAASRVVTVSHGYAWELKTAEGGWGLHNIINENNWKLKGIVNGIDAKEWSPEHDVHLASDGYANFSADTLSTGKPKCKAALQKELGLPLCENVPLIGFIGRLDHQKGVDILAEAIPWMIGQDVQLVMLGAGRNDLEQLLRKFENQHHDKIRGWVGFSVRTAHRIIAGADILLMPSRFEPCGLNQLYAMSYGTVPVVHAVGGLRDTVQPFDPYNEMGVGWTFDKAEANKLIHALGNCLLTYHWYKKSWEGIQRRGMMQDLSWDHAAKNYEEVLIAAKYQW